MELTLGIIDVGNIFMLLLGAGIAFFFSTVTGNLKECREKRRLACILVKEISTNNKIIDLIKAPTHLTAGVKPQNQVFTAFVEKLPLLGIELSRKIIRYYFNLDIHFKEWMAYFQRKQGRQIFEELDNLKECGKQISGELEELCRSRASLKEIFLGP